MATTTTNYELTKAGYNDIPDIETINDNMDTLDSSLVVGESNDDALANITKTTGWTNAEPVTLGDKFQSAMTKISTMIKNLKWIYKFIGSTDISSIGDGTITNAISTLSSNKLNASDVKTSLTDTSTTHALSTASGKALNQAITSLINAFSWKNLPAVTGGNTITLPANWTEANIRFSLDGPRFFMFHVTKLNFNFAQATTYNLRNGYYADSGNNAFVSVSLLTAADGSATLQAVNAVLTGVDKLSTSGIQVRYR